jgi:hypothetical protein
VNLDYCVSQLSINAAAIRQMVAGVDADQATWKPDPESWSILEVVNHLYDEECEDFKARIRHILSGAAGEAPPIRPKEWVTERAYNQRKLGESIDNFMQERQQSLDWLKSVKADWDSTYTAPWGSIRAGDFLVAWVAHDLLHLRQLVELKWSYGLQQSAPYNPGYAGDCNLNPY